MGNDWELIMKKEREGDELIDDITNKGGVNTETHRDNPIIIYPITRNRAYTTLFSLFV